MVFLQLRELVRLVAISLACITLGVGCGGGEEGLSGGNTRIRVDAPLPESTQPSMGIRISCNGALEVPDQDTGDFDFETELELKSGDKGQSFWEGVFDLPLGECVFTLGLHCSEELVCVGSQSITIEEGDNIFDDVVLVCPLSIGAFDPCYP